MALNVNIIGKDSEGNLQALKVNSEGNLEISGFSEWGELLQDISDKLSGNIASDSGLASQRPAANTVRLGFVYWSVDTDVIEYSDGTNWVVM